MAAASSIRHNMLWRLSEANSGYIDGFLTLPDHELYRLCFVSYSKLCYTLISQAKVTFALLDAFDSADGGMLNDSETQTSMAQLVIARVGYIRSCTSLLDKFDAASPRSLKLDGNVDAMQQFSNLTKSMILGYSKQLQARFEHGVVCLDGTSSVTPRRQADSMVPPAGSANDNLRDVIMPTQGSADDMGTTDWTAFNVTSMDDIIGFDEKAWEAIVNEFMLPS